MEAPVRAQPLVKAPVLALAIVPPLVPMTLEFVSDEAKLAEQAEM